MFSSSSFHYRERQREVEKEWTEPLSLWSLREAAASCEQRILPGPWVNHGGGGRGSEAGTFSMAPAQQSSVSVCVMQTKGFLKDVISLWTWTTSQVWLDCRAGEVVYQMITFSFWIIEKSQFISAGKNKNPHHSKNENNAEIVTPWCRQITVF